MIYFYIRIIQIIRTHVDQFLSKSAFVLTLRVLTVTDMFPKVHIAVQILGILHLTCVANGNLNFINTFTFYI